MKMVLIFLMCLLVLAGGCGRQSFSLDQNWLSRAKIAESQDSLSGGVGLSQWQNTIVAVQTQDGGLAKYLLLNSNDNSWAELNSTRQPLQEVCH